MPDRFPGTVGYRPRRYGIQGPPLLDGPLDPVVERDRSRLVEMIARRHNAGFGSGRSLEARPGLTPSPRLTGVGLLLIFLAGVMCLCGTLGYQHLAGPAASLEAHPEPVQADSRAEHAAEHGPATTAFTATTLLVAASVGAALWLAFRHARSLRLLRARLSVRRPPPKTAPLATRKPVRSQLQIFLL